MHLLAAGTLGTSFPGLRGWFRLCSLGGTRAWLRRILRLGRYTARVAAAGWRGRDVVEGDEPARRNGVGTSTHCTHNQTVLEKRVWNALEGERRARWGASDTSKQYQQDQNNS